MTDKATEKQLSFISAIEDTLGYKFDYDNGSKKEASEYISKHIDEYNDWKKSNAHLLASDWALDNGYF